MAITLASCVKDPLVSPVIEETIVEECICGTVRGINGHSCSTDPADNWIRVQNECTLNIDTFFVSYETVMSHFPGAEWCAETSW